MIKEHYLEAKRIIEHDVDYPASKISFAYEQIEKWEFANQRVIEELERLLENEFNEWVDEIHGYAGSLAVASRELRDRIKELKQELV